MIPEAADVARLRDAQTAERQARGQVTRAWREAARFRHDRACLLVHGLGLVLMLIAAVTGSVFLTITYWPYPLILIPVLIPLGGLALDAWDDLAVSGGSKVDGQHRREVLVQAHDAYEDALFELMHAERGMPLRLVCPDAGIAEWEQAQAGHPLHLVCPHAGIDEWERVSH